MTPVCSVSLLGKEQLSPSDRCWHYHPSILPSSGTQPMHWPGLIGARPAAQQRQRAAALILDEQNGHAYFGSTQRRCYSYGPHPHSLWRKKALLAKGMQTEGGLTGLIYQPLINDNAPSTSSSTLSRLLVSILTVYLWVHTVPWGHHHRLKDILSWSWAPPSPAVFCAAFNSLLIHYFFLNSHFAGSTGHGPPHHGWVVQMVHGSFSFVSFNHCNTIYFPPHALTVNLWVEIKYLCLCIFRVPCCPLLFTRVAP